MGKSKAKKLWKRQMFEERKKNYSNGLWCDPYDWVWYGYIAKDKLEKIIGAPQQQPAGEGMEVPQLSFVAERGVKLEQSGTIDEGGAEEDQTCPVDKIIGVEQPACEGMEVPQPSSVAERGVKLEQSRTIDEGGAEEDRRCPVDKITGVGQPKQQPAEEGAEFVAERGVKLEQSGTIDVGGAEEDQRCPVGRIIDFDP